MMALHFAAAAACGAPVDASARLDEFKGAYEKEEERLVADKLEAVRDVRARYLEAVNTLAERKQAAGELEALLTVRSEIERFEKNPEVERGDLAESLPELQTLQEIYMRLRAQTEVDYWEGALHLADGSDSWLDRFQRELTRDGDLEHALAVKEERSEVAARRKVIEEQLTAARELTRSLQKQEEEQPSAGEDAVPDKQEPGAKNRTKPAAEISIIRQRYDQFYRYLLADNWGKAVKYVNPADVERKGTNALKLQLRFMSGLSKLARDMDLRVRGSKVTLSDDGHAVLVPRFLVQGERKDGIPVRWIKIGGQWYVDVD